jgi:hypothetical protein
MQEGGCETLAPWTTLVVARAHAVPGGAVSSPHTSGWRRAARNCALTTPPPTTPQTVRLTSPAFTLAMVVMLLDGANFLAASYMAPGVHGYAARPGVQQSMLLRFGVAAGWFLVLGTAQWLWKAAVAHRLAGHPLACFVDLLFLANTSAVVLEDRGGGYYLHGRNQMHHAGARARPRPVRAEPSRPRAPHLGYCSVQPRGLPSDP